MCDSHAWRPVVPATLWHSLMLLWFRRSSVHKVGRMEVNSNVKEAKDDMIVKNLDRQYQEMITWSKFPLRVHAKLAAHESRWSARSASPLLCQLYKMVLFFTSFFQWLTGLFFSKNAEISVVGLQVSFILMAVPRSRTKTRLFLPWPRLRGRQRSWTYSVRARWVINGS